MSARAAKPVRIIIPTHRHERRLWREGIERVIGVDEVGVAPTSGAVVAAAVLMPVHRRRIKGVRDSKTLSPQQRQRLAVLIRRQAEAIGVGAASVAEIDRLNIYHATHLAMLRAIRRIPGYGHVLVDGRRIVDFEKHVGPYTAIVDGDAICYSIACASIIAKVVRDRMMAKLARRYPQYGWEHNAGYATPDHREALRLHGATPFHRRSFAPVQEALMGIQQTFDFAFDFDFGPGGVADADDGPMVLAVAEVDPAAPLRTDTASGPGAGHAAGMPVLSP